MIFFSMEALRTPRQEEPFGQESLDFVKNRLFQRDVEIEVSNVDKGGNFLGTLFLNRKNFQVQILEAGLGKVIRPAAERSVYGTEFFAAEELAKEKLRKLWKDYDAEAEAAARAARQAARAEEHAQQQNREIIQVTVTEILGGGAFYVQKLADEVVLTELMATLNAVPPSEPTAEFTQSLKKGSAAVAKFAADDKWYRVTVSDLSDDGSEAKIQYVDYGNVDFVPTSSLHPVPESVKAVPAQAVQCVLAFLKVPGQYEDFGEEAGMYLRDLVWGKNLTANVEARDGDELHLSLGDPQSKDLVNVAMVKAGFATLKRRPLGYNPALISLCKTQQEVARKNRNGMWVYGDVPDDELDA